MRDDETVGTVAVEDVVDQAHQVEPVLHHQTVALQAAERDLLDQRDLGELGDLREQFARTETLVRLDVPREVETVDADRIDGPTGGDECHAAWGVCHALSVLVRA